VIDLPHLQESGMRTSAGDGIVDRIRSPKFVLHARKGEHVPNTERAIPKNSADGLEKTEGSTVILEFAEMRCLELARFRSGSDLCGLVAEIVLPGVETGY
jgi:hypothetical protein